MYAILLMQLICSCIQLSITLNYCPLATSLSVCVKLELYQFLLYNVQNYTQIYFGISMG